MRFISIRQMRQNSTDFWKQLKEHDEIILTSNGKPVAILAGVDENSVEKFLTTFRRVKATQALEDMHKASVQAGTSKMNAQEIDSEIKAVRKERKL